MEKTNKESKNPSKSASQTKLKKQERKLKELGICLMGVEGVARESATDGLGDIILRLSFVPRGLMRDPTKEKRAGKLDSFFLTAAASYDFKGQTRPGFKKRAREADLPCEASRFPCEANTLAREILYPLRSGPFGGKPTEIEETYFDEILAVTFSCAFGCSGPKQMHKSSLEPASHLD